MRRYITAEERKPQPGDVIRTHFDGVLTVEADYGHAALVTSKNYRTRLGWSWIRGGWQGEASSGPYRVIPAEYISRADGGDILHPIDAGAWV